MDLSEIQQAIELLPSEQQTKLAAWLSERDHAQWDCEIEKDFSAGGAGMKLLDHVRAEIDRGRSSPMAQGRPQK